MIVFDLRCTSGHVFEAWFKDSAAFDKQQKRGILACAICGSNHISKAPMAPRLSLKARHGVEDRDQKNVDQLIDGDKITTPDEPALPAIIAQAVEPLAAQLRELRDQIIAQTEPVGDKFAEEARKMHYGETEMRAIRGQTTVDEAKELIDEGIEFGVLPYPDRFDA